MKTSIIAVGTELLFGQTVNTNAAFLSQNLNLMGFDVMYHFVVGDNPQRLKDKIDEAFSCSDLIILTGGLGPTQDDLTKEIVAEKMGAELVVDEHVVADLNAFFKKRGIPMADNNFKQAYLPEGSVPFYNDAGTAPGFALEKDGKTAICFPGPPREMTWLFENRAKAYLEKFIDKKMCYRIIRTIGIGESDLETLLLPVIDGQTDPTIATYVKEGEAMIRVASQRSTMAEAEAAVQDMIDKINSICGQYIYSYDNEELNEVVVNLLKEKGLRLSSAESCTGGMFASCITDVPGASKVFTLSMVTYSEESKIKQLGVSSETIDKYGVSSAETAVSMAEAALEKGEADIAVSITGNAGPDAYEGQQGGQAFIGYATSDRSGHIYIDTGGRNHRRWNRNFFRLIMLRTVYRIIKGEL